MLDHPGPFSEAHGGPIMAQSSTKNGPSWPRMALHDPKWPCMTPNGLKILLTGILHEIMSCWTSLGPFHRPTGPQNGTKYHQNSPLWPKIALHDPKWPFMTQNDASMKSLHDPKCPCMTPNGHETFLRGIIHDYMPYWTTLWPFQRPTWPPWASEKAPGWSSMTQYHVIYPWEVF